MTVWHRISAPLVLGLSAASLVAPSGAAVAAPSGSSAGDPCAAVRAARGPYVSPDPAELSTTGTLRIMGDVRSVDLASVDGTSLDWGDPSRNLWYRSLYWVASTALYASENNQPGVVDQMVATVEGYHSRTPDPGGADLTRAAQAGWDEGTVTRRQEAVNCLYSIAPRAGLAAVLRQLSTASLDDRRYFGPPQRLPHNHGLMANQALWTTGELLGDGTLTGQAISRLTRDFQKSFSARGVTIEGSTVYQFFLYPEWQRVAKRLRDSGRGAAADVLDRKLAGVWQAALHMIAPNGDISKIGDGFPEPLFPSIDPGTPLQLKDATALYAARFAWNDPGSPYVTLRVGKKRGSHGHDDLGSVSWFAKGGWVLADAGSFNYSSSSVNLWLRTRAAHNIPSTTMQPSANGRSGYTAILGRSSQTADAGSVAARLAIPGKAGSVIDRKVDYTRASRLTVADRGRALMVQQFTLDPSFSQASLATNGRRAVFRATDGRTLTVTVPKGNRISTVRGRETPRAGWVAPGWEKLVAATMIQNTGSKRGQPLRTTFAVR